ncbi:MAG: DnaJ domain-containing protein, partial [Candidatus Woesearchaeota archaeon]|nr:DnaJ domain-containing protein [Candidatus Woesearchaeota archaeon]
MAKDYYETLGVSNTAGQDEIKRAYKELAKKYHPDLHKGDKDKEEKFKEINEAYKVLSDDKSRANYDRFGSSEYNQGFQAGDSGFDFRGFDFSDI